MMIYLELDKLIKVVRSVFHEGTKYYMQGFLDECLHKL